MERVAVGFIETYGFVPAVIAADTAAKTADVKIVGIETTRGKAGTPGLVAQVKITGSVDAVKAAVEAGKASIEQFAEIIAAHVIARPDSSLEKSIGFTNIQR